MNIKTVLNTSLIAPCGMNCSLCSAYQREKNHCAGCITIGLPKVNHCSTCAIRNCEMLKEGKSKYCFSCRKYPCSRIKHIDKRYRTRYGMSMIENLDTIKSAGIRKFVNSEKEKWACPNCSHIICVHKKLCLVCGKKRVAKKFGSY